MKHGAYILARFSTDNQDADSIDVQVNACREYCERQHLPVLDIFADIAISGMKDTRPEYQRMMSQLANGGADTVVMYDQSRMFRKMTLWFAFRETCASLGVHVISVTQPLIGGDLRDPANFLTEGSMALFNQMWVLQTRQKVIAKMRYMANNGEYTGGIVPYGFDVVDGKLTVNESEAAVVRSIFKDYANGVLLHEISDRLAADGITNKQGRKFPYQTLSYMLSCEKYIGILTYGEKERTIDGKRRKTGNVIRIENAFPAIVDRATWDKAQERSKKNKKERSGRPPVRREYPLKNKVFCRECKSALSVEISKDYHYYICKTCKQNGKRTRISVPALENTVANAIRERYTVPDNLDALMKMLREVRSTVDVNSTAKLERLILREKNVEAQINAATDAILQGACSDTLISKINALEAEKAQINKDMQTLRSQVSGAEISESRVRELMQLAMSDLKTLLTLVVRVEVGKDEIVVWTLLDAAPDGSFDFNDKGVEIYENSVDRLPSQGNYNKITIVGNLLCFTIKRNGKGS